MFKKLFEIKFNNKTFLILVDENHRRTFLEIKDGKYCYPLAEDFNALHKIYNEKDPSVSYVSKFNFKESVIYNRKVIGVLLAIEIGALAGSIVGIASEAATTGISFRHREYDDALVYLESVYQNEHVSKMEVVIAINANNNLNDREKDIALKLLDTFLELDPDMNLRIFYENIKSLKIEKMSIAELYEKKGIHIGGCYSAKTNTILIRDDYSDFDFAHELCHIAHNYHRNFKGKSVNVYDFAGDFLEEAMTDMIAGHGFGYNAPYYMEKVALEFFLYNANKFDFHTYNKCGVEALISELKELYPNVDIDYIVDFYNTNMDTNLTFGEVVKIEESYELLDEMFKITLSNINMDDPFEAFEAFMNISFNNRNVYDKYLPRYIEALLKAKNIPEQEVSELYSIVSSIDRVAIINGNCYLANEYFYFDSNHNRYDRPSYSIDISLFKKSREGIVCDLLDDINVFSSDYTHKLLLKNLRANEIFLRNLDEERKIILANKVFDCLFDPDKKYSEMLNIYNSLERIVASDETLRDKYLDELQNRFREGCIKVGNISIDDYYLLYYLRYIIVIDGEYYLSTGYIGDIPTQRYENGYYEYGIAKDTIISSKQVEIECVNENGMFMLPLPREIANTYYLYEDMHDELFDYFFGLEGERFTKENISNFIEEYDLKEKIEEISCYKNAFSFRDGLKVYSGEFDDSVILQVGKDNNDKLCYRLISGENIIYENGVIDGPYASIPYKKYVIASLRDKDRYMGELLDERTLLETLERLAPILPSVSIEYYGEGEVKSVNFVEPLKIECDGNSVYAREIFIRMGMDGNNYIYYPDNTRCEIDLGDKKHEVFCEYLDDAMRYLDIDSNKSYQRDEIEEIFKEYINQTYAIIK